MKSKAAIPLLMVVFLGLCALAGAEDNPKVVLQTCFGDVLIELYPTQAPVTVENFLHYVDTGFYDGTVIHRIVNNPAPNPFGIIQGGSHYIVGYTIYEKTPDLGPIINESDNGLSNLRGTIAMARTDEPNSATSQFYFNQIDNTSLDKANDPCGIGYCVFGEVISGIEVLDIMAEWNTIYISSILKNFPVPPVSIYRAFRASDEYPLQSFGTGAQYWLKADVNYDGTVDGWDLDDICYSWLTENSLGQLPVNGLVNFGEFAELAQRWKWTSVWHRFAPADIDNNRNVNLRDFALLAGDWHKDGVELRGDLNLDETVNHADLERLIYDWQKTAP